MPPEWQDAGKYEQHTVNQMAQHKRPMDIIGRKKRFKKPLGHDELT